jgi:hypothetical protein
MLKLLGSGWWCSAKLLLCEGKLIVLWEVEEKLGDRKTEIVREQEGFKLTCDSGSRHLRCADM